MNETYPNQQAYGVRWAGASTADQLNQELKQGYFVEYRHRSRSEAVNLLKGMQAAFELAGQKRIVCLIPSCGPNSDHFFDVCVVGERKGN